MKVLFLKLSLATIILTSIVGLAEDAASLSPTSTTSASVNTNCPDANICKNAYASDIQTIWGNPKQQTLKETEARGTQQ